MWLLVAGVLIGSVKTLLPLGPTGLLVVERALRGQSARAMAVAAGGVLAEALYCFGAVFGLRTILGRRPEVLDALREAGALVIFALGVYFLLFPVRWRTRRRYPHKGARAGDVLLGLSTAGLNPALLFTWSLVVGLLASQGLSFAGAAGLLFPPSVAAGTLGANAGLVLLLRRLKRRIDKRRIAVLVRMIGAFLVGLAALQFFTGGGMDGAPVSPAAPPRHRD
jgi:threonine/homoserine/homoserine lactone efflux protein